MDLTQKLLGTGPVQSITNALVFFLILAIVLNFVMKAAGIGDGKFSFKNLTEVGKNIKTHLPEMLKSLLITLLVFVVFGLSGILGLAATVLTGIGGWIKAILEWLANNIF